MPQSPLLILLRCESSIENVVLHLPEAIVPVLLATADPGDTTKILFTGFQC